MDGQFRGSIIRIVRGKIGEFTEKIEEDHEGKIVRRDVIGPYGIVEQTGYENGVPTSRATWRYDPNGHRTEFYRYDQDGRAIESSFSMSDASGNFKEERDYGRNGSFLLHFVETNDPKTETWSFTNFSENGSVKVAITAQGHKLLSFWQQTDEDQVYGSSFFLDRLGKTQDSYSCHRDSRCNKVTSYSSDETGRDVSRVEWHDPAGVLRLAFDYEYDRDEFGNWTKRTVWVWSPKLGEQKLYETDYRTLNYW